MTKVTQTEHQPCGQNAAHEALSPGPCSMSTPLITQASLHPISPRVGCWQPGVQDQSSGWEGPQLLLPLQPGQNRECGGCSCQGEACEVARTHFGSSQVAEEGSAGLRLGQRSQPDPLVFLELWEDFQLCRVGQPTRGLTCREPTALYSTHRPSLGAERLFPLPCASSNTSLPAESSHPPSHISSLPEGAL